MIQYTLLDPITGQQLILSEDKLIRNIRLNCILFRDEEHIGIIIHRDLVAFSRWCAGKILDRMEHAPHQSVTHALTMVDRWLEDEKSVTPEELEAAARAAEAVAESASQTVARAAEAVAESASQTVAWAAWAAARAVWVATRAVTEAVSAATQGYVSYEAQAQWLVEHLKSGK